MIINLNVFPLEYLRCREVWNFLILIVSNAFFDNELSLVYLIINNSYYDRS